MGNSTNHPRHSGQFQKGDDKRRNTKGQRSARAVAFTKTLRELIVKFGEAKLPGDDKKRKRVEVMVETLWRKAILGESWAVQMIADRVEGKVADRTELTGKDGGPIPLKVTEMVIKLPKTCDDSPDSVEP